jgi:uncharacterized protein (TIGR02246 family)
MRSHFIASFALLALLAPTITLAGGAADEQTIKDGLNDFQSAWNKDDTSAMAKVFTEDATLINPFGVEAHGRDAMSKVFAQEHSDSGPFKGSKYETREVKIQWITPDVALVDAAANISGVRGKDGAAAPDFLHHVTWIFVKKNGNWMAAAARPYKYSAEPK